MTNTNPPTNSLPLGWTRVKRRRANPRKTENESGNEKVVNGWYCDDKSCTLLHENLALSFEESSPSNDMYEGLGIFCLQDIAPTWFQGHFQGQTQGGTFGGNSAKPLALLATEEENSDSCLQCREGGNMNMKLSMFKGGKETRLGNVVWSGGDMVRLSSKSVSFETERLFSGTKAVPYVERYFASLVRKLRGSTSEDEPILNLMPNVVVVAGNMRMSIPKPTSVEQDE